MATIGSTLQLYDKFSQTLSHAEERTRSMLNVASELKRTIENPFDMKFEMDSVSQLTAVRKRIEAQLSGIQARIQIELPANLERMFANLQRLVMRLMVGTRQLRARSQDEGQLAAVLERVKKLEERINQLQDGMNRKLREGKSAADGLLGQIKSIAATYLSIQGAKSLLGSTMGGAMEQLKIEDMFKARTGDVEVGSAMFEKFKAEALAAGQDVNETLKSTLSFFSATQNTGQLSQLNKLTSRLAAFDSAGNGIEGAAFALKEAMSGDIVSLAERFNMSKADIRALKIDELGKSGDMDGFIKAFDQLLEKQKMGQAAFDTMMASPAKQVEKLGNNFRSAMADAGGAAVQALMPLITIINTAFQEGRFQPFFDGLSAGLAWIVNGAITLYDAIYMVYMFFANNWSTIEPILYGVGSALLILFAALKAVAIGQAIVNAVMAVNPFILIAIAIIALVMYLYRLWQTNDKFAAGLMRAWNSILNFFDQVPIFFAWVGNGITNAFQDAKVTSLRIMESMVNGVIDSVNWLIEKLNKIPGVSIEALNHVEFSSKAAAEAEAIRQAGEDAINAMQTSAAEKAAAREQKVQKMLAGREADRAAREAEDNKSKLDGNEILKKWDSGAGANINKVGEVGKINKTVDISSEDLKVIRDLAEIKSIQNYVTLTPTVNVTTGPISKEVDVDEVILRIGARVSEEIESSADGIYAM